MDQLEKEVIRRRKTIALRLLMLWAVVSAPSRAFAWGEHGHEIVAELGTSLVEKTTLANCRTAPDSIVQHTNDPDQAWKSQRFRHPDEPRAHFFHVDKQPENWRTRNDAADVSQGFLVYRILDWVQKAKELRRKGNWESLSEHLYGLSHYVADLTQPLHLLEDHDGANAKIEGIHSQYEGKMLKRYRNEIEAGVQKRLAKEGIPGLWSSLEYRKMIFDTAEQSYKKASRLFELARPALLPERRAKKSRRKIRPEFVKSVLFEQTDEFTMDQLALASRLLAHTLNLVCR